MGRVKSEMFEDDLGPDDELVPKPLNGLFGESLSVLWDNMNKSADTLIHNARIAKEIEECELPRGSLERYEFVNKKTKELIHGITTNFD